jgi:hypothetical protein
VVPVKISGINLSPIFYNLGVDKEDFEVKVHSVLRCDKISFFRKLEMMCPGSSFFSTVQDRCIGAEPRPI